MCGVIIVNNETYSNPKKLELAGLFIDDRHCDLSEPCLEVCFCCWDAEGILNDNNVEYTYDPVFGDYIVDNWPPHISKNRQ